MKNHDFKGQTNNLNYVFETSAEETTITAYGYDVKQGDRIEIDSYTFEVQQVEYYAAPSDLFRASLSKFNEIEKGKN
ncbi:hypothetical protein [Cylindrospermum sp. FACHB-282]|uniref:hypothetical protein n=1 Tax=Cylindrospermum sp. FACHB-282 TaxID=2692794 RepID=UPI001683B158|nr:hypothetical protein [Cylindrospermum sp. FACHB-282]MBD2385993.1 hypothetical protein [Cylindrospermum sp. FACHB-282]